MCTALHGVICCCLNWESAYAVKPLAPKQSENVGVACASLVLLGKTGATYWLGVLSVFY